MLIKNPNTPDYDKGLKPILRPKSQEVNGVTISISTNTEWVRDLNHIKYEELTFSEGDDEETLEVRDLPTEIILELFDEAIRNVPADHPQKLYIAYGAVKQRLNEERKRIKEETERKQKETDEAYRASLDTSYSESAETKNGKISISWMSNAGEYGAYVITFPDAEGFIIDDKLSRRKDSVAWKKPLSSITMRPDLAKKFFDAAVEMLNEGHTVQDVQSSLRSLQSKYDKKYLWSQDPNIEHPDLFYYEVREIHGIKISVAWNRFNDKFSIMFLDHPSEMPGAKDYNIYDDNFNISRKTEDAKRVLEYACQQAELKNGNILEVVKAVENMISDIQRA